MARLAFGNRLSESLGLPFCLLAFGVVAEGVTRHPQGLGKGIGGLG